MSTHSKLEDATLTLQDRVATLILQRDDVRNALTGTQLIDDIVNRVAWVNRQSDVSLLIVTGEGKAFNGFHSRCTTRRFPPSPR